MCWHILIGVMIPPSPNGTLRDGHVTKVVMIMYPDTLYKLEPFQLADQLDNMRSLIDLVTPGHTDDVLKWTFNTWDTLAQQDTERPTATAHFGNVSAKAIVSFSMDVVEFTARQE